MQFGIDPTTKTITLFTKVNLLELVETLNNMNFDFEEWTLDFEPATIYKNVPTQPDYPWITPPFSPYPLTNPNPKINEPIWVVPQEPMIWCNVCKV